MTQRRQRPGRRACGSRIGWSASSSPMPSIRGSSARGGSSDSSSKSRRSTDERLTKRRKKQQQRRRQKQRQRRLLATRRSRTPHSASASLGFEDKSDDRQRRKQLAQRSSGLQLGRATVAAVVHLDGSKLQQFLGTAAGPVASSRYSNLDGDKIVNIHHNARFSQLVGLNSPMLAERDDEDKIRRAVTVKRSKRENSLRPSKKIIEPNPRGRDKIKDSKTSATASARRRAANKDAITRTIIKTRSRSLRCPSSIDQRRPIVQVGKGDEVIAERLQSPPKSLELSQTIRAANAIESGGQLNSCPGTVIGLTRKSARPARSAPSVAGPTRNPCTMFVPLSAENARRITSFSPSSSSSSSTPAASSLMNSSETDDNRRWLLATGSTQSQETYNASLMAVASASGSSSKSGPDHKKQRTETNEIDLIKSVSRAHKWHWSESDKSHECVIGKDKLSLCFHPQCSESTATCRGSEPFRRNANYYYWEIHVEDKVYGTSVMFGLCTKQQRLHANEYCNLVGLDDQGWSLSHKGLIWHNGIRRQFTSSFPANQPITIGLLYNTLRGELSYFMDGKNLGVAFCGLNDIEDDLYPVVGSTAKSTRMHLIGSYCGYVSLLERSCFTLIRGNRNVGELIEYLRQGRLPKCLVDYVAQVPIKHKRSYEKKLRLGEQGSHESSRIKQFIRWCILVSHQKTSLSTLGRLIDLVMSATA